MQKKPPSAKPKFDKPPVGKPPFDKPLSFTKLFDRKTQTAIMAAINKVKDNALVSVA